MAHLSIFLPALLDAFENHSPYVRKVVNPLPLFSTDSVFNKALSFWAHVLIVLHLLEFTYVERSSVSSLKNDAALQPVTISRSTMPKLYTSDFIEYDLP